MFILIRGLSRLPLGILYGIASMFTGVLRLLGYRKKVIEENLKNAFPEKSPKEIRQLRRAFYRNFAQVMMESLKTVTMPMDKLAARTPIKNLSVLDDLYDSNQGAILVLSHSGNWEWACHSLILQAKQKSIGVYKPLSNPSWDAFMQSIRKRSGTQLTPMKQAARAILKAKEPTISLLIADQTPHHTEIEFNTLFLNQDTPVFLGPEKLALLSKQSLIFVETKRIKRGKYELVLHPLYKPEEGKLAGNEITKRHVQALEKAIHRQPELWLWSHRRWKYAKKHA